MRRQAELGDVDFITGDYLAEMNLADNADAYAAGKHDGFERTAWDGIVQSIDVISQKRIKVIINGGGLNPKGLALKTLALIQERGFNLKVAFVSGDDLLPYVKSNLSAYGRPPDHLEHGNEQANLPRLTDALLDTTSKPVVSANAYLGARAIVKGLERGADIVICGRVADASPVIGAAWWWYSWSETDYDQLAGAFIAGHLIECSAYVTGGNFSGFTDFDLESLIDVGYPIAEIEHDGTCIVTKPPGTRGMVIVDTVKCQFLYELQGDAYLNSDVKALLHDVQIEQVGVDRVKLSGITGRPPPPTTKLAIFYKAGYQSQVLVNATGYGTDRKWELQEKQVRHSLKKAGVLDKFDVLDFQVVGTPEPNPSTQLRSTTYLRIFAQADDPRILTMPARAFLEYGMQHFSDMRTAYPTPYLAFYPALYPQNDLDESINILSPGGSIATIPAGHPSYYEPFGKRNNYDTLSPRALTDFGPTHRVPLGDVALARSGDKGPNVNFGIFVRTEMAWEWLRSFMSRAKMQDLVGKDWREEYRLERVEFPKIFAVHFVLYGMLDRGVSSSKSLDCLGKGFADFIRDKWVDVPVCFLEERSKV
ncbi:hypothetical protein FGG08_004482 [Glutinoglossum americanum]|uniref:DUF1446 domain-containing protein n=1 Tax=Glutinoglossum americanum TaxID=1670608 RepID=A0A9P8L2P7_9PEZI|nr:hypothetical protein FGG08_004482 [Glutinoglossum americanum]